MAKTNTHPQHQGSFSFFNEVEKMGLPPRPTKNTLQPPVQIIEEEGRDSSTPAAAEGAITTPESEIPETIPTIEPINTSTELVIKETLPSPKEKVPLPQEETTFAGKKSTRGRKPVKAHAATLVELPDDEILFSKMYYSMGEVTTMLNESHSLIRYWESEFDLLKPKKNGKGDRLFRPADVKNLYLIYDLLRRQKYTIEGARKYLKNNKTAKEKFEAIQSLEKIKSFFLELKTTL